MKFVTDILAKANLVVDGSVILNTTPNAIVDTDKFLVQDGATIKYRTGAEVLSDIGAQGAITLTVIGNSGPATLIGNGLNIPTYSLSGLGGVPLTRTLTINGTSYDLSFDRTWSVGTVTSVDMSVPTGFTISGNPITTTGTLALAFASGYALPTVASQLNWNSAYNNMITAISYNTSTGDVTLTQQDLGTLSATITLQPFTTTNLAEGTNLYYTDARARLALSAGTGISYNNLTGVITNSDTGSAQNIFKNIAVTGQNTIVADSNNDTLTVVAGTAISITTDDTTDSITITNTLPDQTVVLTGAGTTVVSGTYPNFTITSNDSYGGTVTNVSALTIGTTGTDLSSSVVNSTTTPVITLNVPTASSVNRGALSAADWSMFNAKQDALTLTTVGSSGASTLIGATLNIPAYTLSGLGGVPSTRTINGLALSSDQTFATGTTGTDFNIVSAGTVHTFNIPDASSTARGLINDISQTINGTKTFLNSPVVPSLFLTNMGAGSGAVYYDVPDNRLTLANYNVGGEIKFEVNGGVYTMTLNSDLTIELMGYTTNGFLKTSGSNGLLVVDTTSYTPTTRTLTINGVAHDLSADRSWSVGTVTSVGLSVPTGFSVASSPVTTSGTIALSFASGYSLPTNASQSNWDAAYTGRIDSLTTTGTSGAATFVANVLNIPQYQAQGNYITSLTGEATGSGPGATTVTLTNSAVIGKVLTGLTVTSGAVVATDSILQAFGKVQGQINALAGGLQFQGTWNANTNSPTITSGVGTQGYFYIVNVAGNTTIDGNTGWQVGDWILFDGTVWQKVDNTDAVTSVNGFTGAVVLTTTNISEGTNLYYTDARARQAISLTTTGSSGAATYSNVTGILNIPQYTLTGLGGVPTSRTITINGTAQDLSVDRTWNVGTVTSIATTGPITGGTITGTGTIGITQATTSTNGYLSSTDWNTFNNKQNAITLTTTGSSGSATFVGATLNIPNYTLSGLGGVPDSRTLTINGTSYDLTTNRTWSVGTVTSITFSGPLTGGTITGSGTVGILQASGSQNGFLSSTDWTTFNNKQNTITLTTTGSSGASTLVGATLNIPTYTLSGLGGVPTSRTLTINGTALDLSVDRSWSVGTVTSVAALTLGTSGTDLNSSVATGTTTPVITLNVPTASATNRGALSSTDWSTFNNKIGGSGTTNYISKFTASGTIGNSQIFDNGTTVGIGTLTPVGTGLEIFNDTISGRLRLSRDSGQIKGIIIFGRNNGGSFQETASITGRADSASQNNGTLTFNTSDSTGASVVRLTLEANGDVRIATINNATIDTDRFLVSDNGVIKYRTGTELLSDIGAQAALTNPVTGTGTANYVARWTGSTTLSTGTLYDTGSAVGIGTTTMTSVFNVTGSNSGSVPLINLTVSGSGSFQRGVRMLNSGMSTGDSLMYAVGRSDDARNMGQFYFYYSSAGSVSNRLSMGLHSVDDVFNIQGTGDVTIGSTTNTGLAKLQVTGAIQQTSVTSSMLKVNSNGVLVAAVAGTDYLTATSSDFTYNASLTLSTSWQNTGVTSANLGTKGTYVVTCYANDYSVGGSQYMCTYVGLMFWYTDGTNSVDTISEIALHHSGHHDGGRFIYLRTLSTLNADGKTYLQIKGNGTNSGASTYTFTFKRLL
jgi:predicted heme/steroid binding protein